MGEPATSYIARIAAHYGLASAREFTGDFGLSFNDIASGKFQELAKLAHLTGCNLDALRDNTPITGEPSGQVRVKNESISTNFSRRQHLIVCPDCWAEDIAALPNDLPEASAYVRLHWLFSPILTCQRHSRQLVMVKTAPTNWSLYDTALLAGDISRQLPGMLASTARREASAFENYATARLYGENAPAAGALDKLGLTEVFSICAHVGRALALQKSAFADMSEDQLYQAYDLGFRTLSGGREALRRAIFDMLEHRSHLLPSTIGPQNFIGQAYFLLVADFVGEQRFAPVYDEIANAIYDATPWGPERAPLFGVPITYRRYYAPTSGGRAYGFAAKTMENYAVAAGIARVFASNSGRRRILIDAQAADSIFDIGGHVAEKHLEKYGITLIQRRAIMGAGLLKTILPRELFPDKEKPPIKITDVQDLMARFLGSAQNIEIMPEGAATLRHISRAIAGRLQEVHQLILDGKIWTGRLLSEPRPYASIIVMPEEVRAALDATILLNTREMSAASGLPKELLIAMCMADKIEHVVDVNPATGKVRRSFNPKTAIWARRELIPLTQLARQSGRQAKTHFKRMSDLGILPFCTVPTGHTRQTVYRVKDVRGLSL